MLPVQCPCVQCSITRATRLPLVFCFSFVLANASHLQILSLWCLVMWHHGIFIFFIFLLLTCSVPSATGQSQFDVACHTQAGRRVACILNVTTDQANLTQLVILSNATAASAYPSLCGTDPLGHVVLKCNVTAHKSFYEVTLLPKEGFTGLTDVCAHLRLLGANESSSAKCTTVVIPGPVWYEPTEVMIHAVHQFRVEVVISDVGCACAA